MPRGALTGGRKFEVPDSFFAGTEDSIDFHTLRNHQSFRPQAVLIGTSSNAVENAAGYATIRGDLFGENETFTADYPLNLRQNHGLAFRRIYRVGTTARGIKIISEI